MRAATTRLRTKLQAISGIELAPFLLIEAQGLSPAFKYLVSIGSYDDAQIPMSYCSISEFDAHSMCDQPSAERRRVSRRGAGRIHGDE
jgi:hypothetical protein